MFAVADTHALLWALTGQTRKLGASARGHFARAERREAVVYVPTFVLIEIGELVERGRVTLPLPFDAWVNALDRSGSVIVHDLTLEVVFHANNLFAIPERCDRLIAASAVALGCPLITRDQAIAACAAVQQLWD